MGFVRVFRKEQHPRGLLAKNEHFLTKLIVSKILAQLCSDDLIQILLNLTWGERSRPKSNMRLLAVNNKSNKTNSEKRILYFS